jgi:UDP-glucose 4-epimerase
MNVLVTGGAGYVGSVCVKKLLSAGHRVVVVDDLSTGHREAVSKDAGFIHSDFSDAQRIDQAISDFNVDAVMHFAAATLVEKSMTDPRYYFDINVRKGLQFLDILLKRDIKNFIFSSTAAVYGEPISVPISEDHPLNPINAYGQSKLMFEEILRWYHRAYGLRYVALRYFNASGAYEELGEDHHPETHLIPLLLQRAHNPSAPFTVFGDDYPTPDGTCVRDYVHIADIAQAHLRALEALPTVKGAVYNVGCHVGRSIAEVIEAAAGVTGQSIHASKGPRRAGDPAVLVASNDKISRELGWKPEFSDLTTILRSAWNWKQQHSNGYTAAS